MRTEQDRRVDNHLHFRVPSAGDVIARALEVWRQRLGFGQRPAVERPHQMSMRATKTPAVRRRHAANKTARRARRVHRVRAAR